MKPTSEITDPTWQDILDRDAEIERLKQEQAGYESLITAQQRAIGKQKTEIERLKSDLEDARAVIQNAVDAAQKLAPFVLAHSRWKDGVPK